MKTIKEAINGNYLFYILSIFSILLLSASFILPPTGVIDSSVLGAVGEMFAFAALGTVIKAIDNNKSISLQKGDTSITVREKEDEE